jgi:cathepsin B
MQYLLLSLLLSVSLGEYAVTQEYIDYLKKHVTWEVADYEDSLFRGWTIDEIKEILNQQEELPETEGQDVVVTNDLPTEIDWTVLKADCTHPIGNQGSCGSCWAFSAAGVVSDRCCMYKSDEGWLSPQELVSCDKANWGCRGGWEFNALDYVAANGLVREKCYPYLGSNAPCPNKCKDGSDWKAAHVCKCKAKVFCREKAAMQECIKTGPLTAGMWVYRDFLTYKGGIYHWNKQGGSLGGHAVRVVAYSETPEPHWRVANSWGIGWGEAGFFRIGVGEAAIESRNPSYCDPA